jgi:hypothetical protein
MTLPPPPAGGYNPAYCLSVLQDKGVQPCEGYVSDFHCTDASESQAYHASCGGQAMYQPVAIPVCMNTATGKALWFPSATFFAQCAAQGQGWGPGICFCCCSCFADETPVATPTGLVRIGQIQKGQDLLVASFASAGGAPKLTWGPKSVAFSAGTAGTATVQPTMVWLVYGSETHSELICTGDQPLLLDNGKFIQAKKIVPGMKLVDQNGKPVPVVLASIGQYVGGVHHIAIDAQWDNSPDNHLILAGGVVAGDFTMQAGFDQLPASIKADDHDDLPMIGSPEYADTHAQSLDAHPLTVHFTARNAKGSAKGATAPLQHTGTFTAYRIAGSFGVPDGAASLLTFEQSKDILMNGQQASLGNPLPQLMFQTIVKQLTGFYPDITFYYDALTPLPNVHAFQEYGKKFVVVTGGLARLVGFNYEGLTMAVGRGIGAFYGGPPKTTSGLAGVGAADFYGFAAVSRNLWQNAPWLTYAMEALKQWQALFDLVKDPANQGGSDPIYDPSLSCRMGAAQSGLAGGDLPECAGGPPLPKMNLQAANADSLQQVSLTFSVGVARPGSTNAASYSLSPDATITAAAYDPDRNFVIRLTVEGLKAGTDYTVTAKGLQSYLGGSLDPDPATAKFTTPAA